MDKNLRKLIEIVSDINLLLASSSLDTRESRRINKEIKELIEVADLEEGMQEE